MRLYVIYVSINRIGNIIINISEIKSKTDDQVSKWRLKLNKMKKKIHTPNKNMENMYESFD